MSPFSFSIFYYIPYLLWKSYALLILMICFIIGCSYILIPFIYFPCPSYPFSNHQFIFIYHFILVLFLCEFCFHIPQITEIILCLSFSAGLFYLLWYPLCHPYYCKWKDFFLFLFFIAEWYALLYIWGECKQWYTSITGPTESSSSSQVFDRFILKIYFLHL